MERHSLAGPFDLALACTLAVLAVAEVLVPFSTVMGSGPRPLAIALGTLACLVLVARRTLPFVVVCLVMLPLSILSLVTPVMVLFWGGLAPMAVAVFSVARYGKGRVPLVGAAVAAASMLLLDLGVDMLREPDELFFPWLVLVTAWFAGWAIQRKEHGAVASERRAVEVEERSREQTLLALAEERARIARELHDVVAHAVTAIVVQAGAAGQVVDDDPRFVRTALDDIRQTGSRALDEMRRAVTLLRESGQDELIAPQPGLADITALVERAGTSGTQVRLVVEGAPRPLPVGADLAAYRIVQEALTNVHRHASASNVDVTVRYGPSSVEVEVADDGVGRAPGSPTGASGHGLVGMRERTSMYGGHLQVRSAAGTGFSIRASLPVETSS